MAVKSLCGMEGGTTSELWSPAGTYQTSSSYAKTGTYAFRSYPTTTGTGSARLPFPGTTGSHGECDIATAYVSFDFLYVTKPATATNHEPIFVSETASGGAKKLHVHLREDGKLEAYVGTGTFLATGSAVLNATTWYRIDIKSPTGTGVAFEVKVNGTTDISDVLTSSGNNARLHIGKQTNFHGETVDFFYDNIVVADDAFVSNSAVVEVMSPDGDGTNTLWTIGSGSGSDWQVVDDLPVAAATDYLVSTLTTGNESGVTLESCSTAGVSGTILATKAITNSRTQSGTGSFKLRVRNGSSTTDLVTIAPTNSQALYSQHCDTDPATSAAWTTSGLDAAEVCVVENSTGTASRCYYMHLFVLFVPGSTPSTYNETVTLSGTAAVTGTGALVATPSVSFSATAAATPAGPVSVPASVALTSTAAATPTGAVRVTPTVALSSTAALSGSGLARMYPTVALSGTAALTGTANIIIQTALTLSGTASFTADGTVSGGGQTYNETATLSATAAVTPTGRLVAIPSLTLSAVAACTATGREVITSTVALSSTAAASATGRLALAQQVALAMAASASASAREIITAQVALGTTASVTPAAIASLAAQIALSATSGLVITDSMGAIVTYDVMRAVGDVLQAAATLNERLYAAQARGDDLVYAEATDEELE